MARKPNYKFEKPERERQKAARNAAKDEVRGSKTHDTAADEDGAALR